MALALQEEAGPRHVPLAVRGLNQCPPMQNTRLARWSKGVQRIYWYAWNDTNYGTLWDVGTHTIRRAGIAYGELEGWLTGAEMTAPCVVAPNSTWTCGFMFHSGVQAQVVWNSSVSTSSTLEFRPAPKYVQYRSLDGSTMPISGGSIQIGNKPLLLITAATGSLTGPSSRSNATLK